MNKYKYEITSTPSSKFSFVAAGQFEAADDLERDILESIIWFELLANAHFSKLGPQSLGDVLVLDRYKLDEAEPVSSDETMTASAHHVLVDGQRVVQIKAGPVVKAFNENHDG